MNVSIFTRADERFKPAEGEPSLLEEPFDPILLEHFTEMVNHESTSTDEKNLYLIDHTWVRFMSGDNEDEWDKALFRVIWKERDVIDDDNQEDGNDSFFMGYYTVSTKKADNVVFRPVLINELRTGLRLDKTLRLFRSKKTGLLIHTEVFYG